MFAFKTQFSTSTSAKALFLALVVTLALFSRGGAARALPFSIEGPDAVTDQAGSVTRFGRSNRDCEVYLASVGRATPTHLQC